MSVTDFTKKFEELSYYSTHNEYAGNEMWKVNQYKYALRGELYAVVSQQRVTDYDELVHNSLEAERSFDKAAREGSGASGRNRGNFVDKYHDKLKPKRVLHKGENIQVHPGIIQLVGSVAKLIRDNAEWALTTVLHADKQGTLWQIVQIEETRTRV
jgi:hypothetical protein